MPGLVPGIYALLAAHAKTWMRGSSPRMTNERASLPLDIRLAHDAGVFLELLADMGREAGSAGSHRIEREGRELLLDLRYLHGGGEPLAELHNCVGRRLGGRDQPEPHAHVEILVAGFRDGRQIGQRLQSGPSGGGGAAA